MNFHELRVIVNQIKRNMRCPVCNGKYKDEDIDVISSIDGEDSFFHAYCSSCQDQSCIHVDMHFDSIPSEDFRLGIAPRMEHISTNEVLDMHNFLKSFNGNFEQMFDQKQNKNA